MDDQAIQSIDNGDMLPLMEAFYTIQGEGFHAGKAAFFLRIGGCDVGCHWCDVKESWDASLHPPTSVSNIITEISKQTADTVVITGGEPLMWNLTPLSNAIKSMGLQVHLETSGAYEFSGCFDWICLSPKKMLPPLQKIKNISNEFKVIINNKHDLVWAEEQRKGLTKNCKLYLQPEWSRRELVLPIIINYVKKNKDWSISLQSHKYMKIP